MRHDYLCFFGLLIFIGWLLFELNNTKKMLIGEEKAHQFTLSKLNTLRNQYDSISNATIHLVYSTKQKNEFFRYYRIMADTQKIGFILESNLPMRSLNFKRFERWIETSWHNSIPDTFTVATLFDESRVTTNILHKPNFDGSVDHGDVGLNGKYIRQDSIYYFDYELRKFVEHYQLVISKYPPHLRRKVYRLGETKARRLGLIN